LAAFHKAMFRSFTYKFLNCITFDSDTRLEAKPDYPLGTVGANGQLNWGGGGNKNQKQFASPVENVHPLNAASVKRL
jgi:hypothetical protein